MVSQGTIANKKQIRTADRDVGAYLLFAVMNNVIF